MRAPPDAGSRNFSQPFLPHKLQLHMPSPRNEEIQENTFELEIRISEHSKQNMMPDSIHWVRSTDSTVLQTPRSTLMSLLDHYKYYT